jgi:hypothetical protein
LLLAFCPILPFSFGLPSSPWITSLPLL